MILVIGEILFDLFPDYKRIGGAPFNFAFHLKQLGFEICFISRVGQDDLGREILDFIEKNGFDPQDIQIDPIHPTGTVDINMDDSGDHSFSIIKNRAWDHIEWDKRLQHRCAGDPEMVYFGSLIQRTPNGEKIIQKVLEKTARSTHRFCDINLRPDAYTRRVVDKSVANSDILKLSHEELDVLVPGQDKDLNKRAASLLTKGPQLIILTRGPKGSLWIREQDTLEHHGPESGSINIVDTVGAGDAYAAMSAAGLLTGLPPDRTMMLAQGFAQALCSIEGALPKNNTIYQEFIRYCHE